MLRTPTGDAQVVSRRDCCNAPTEPGELLVGNSLPSQEPPYLCPSSPQAGLLDYWESGLYVLLAPTALKPARDGKESVRSY